MAFILNEKTLATLLGVVFLLTYATAWKLQSELIDLADNRLVRDKE